MTVPPQGPYGSQPNGGGEPQWGGQPPQGSGPYPGGRPAGPPPQGPSQQYGQPGAAWAHQQWAGGPPPIKGGKGKWVLIGLALVAVIAVSIVTTVLVLRPDSGGRNGQSPTAIGDSEFASADDTGPANIITDDPTCEAWRKISKQLDSVAERVKWNEQDYRLPASKWTAEQRNAFEEHSTSLEGATASVASLAKQTPHRVMRELYGQFNAYSRAVIDAIPTYDVDDNYAVAVSNQLFTVINRVCDAVYFRAASQTAPLVTAPLRPSDPREPSGDGKMPERFLGSNSGSCSDWIAMVERFNHDEKGKAWRDLDPNIRVEERTADQVALVDDVVPLLNAYANDMERIGRASGNPIWEDLAIFAAQYLRAYIQGIPTYSPNYVYMSLVSTTLPVAIYWACKATL